MGKKYGFKSGKVLVKYKLNLKPQDVAPVNPATGDMYVRGADNKARIYTGSAWETISSS